MHISQRGCSPEGELEVVDNGVLVTSLHADDESWAIITPHLMTFKLQVFGADNYVNHSKIGIRFPGDNGEGWHLAVDVATSSSCFDEDGWW